MNRFALLFAVLLFAACGGEDPGAGGPDCWTPPEGVSFLDSGGNDVCLKEPEEKLRYCFTGGIATGSGVASTPPKPSDCGEEETPVLYLTSVLDRGDPTYAYLMICDVVSEDNPCDGRPGPLPDGLDW